MVIPMPPSTLSHGGREVNKSVGVVGGSGFSGVIYIHGSRRVTYVKPMRRNYFERRT